MRGYCAWYDDGSMMLSRACHRRIGACAMLLHMLVLWSKPMNSGKKVRSVHLHAVMIVECLHFPNSSRCGADGFPLYSHFFSNGS